MNEAKKYSILVVDDENSNIMNLTHILSQDYTVYAAKNGANAIRAAETYLPDVILLDIIMPDINGYDAISVLKNSEKTKNIPVIFITGLSDADDEEKGLALGAADYLIKPFSPALVKLRVLNQIKLIEQFRTNEYDIMKYKLSNDALNIALWDMDVVHTDPINPVNKFTWSQEFRHMLGFSDENDFPDVFHSWSDRLHFGDKEQVLNAFAAHINDYTGQTPYDIECRLMLKNGEYRHFHALGTTRRDKDGVPIRVAGALIDITEKKQMEHEIDEFIEKIEATAHWYKSILDAIPLPISVTDTDMNFTFVNKAVEEFLGTKSEDIIGNPCSNWKIGICSPENCATACTKRDLKQTFFNIKNSSYQVDVEILRDIAGEIAGFIEVVQDITNVQQLAKQQAETEMTSKAKSAFLANMSHEIRTPMNAIWGITEILMQDGTLPQEAKDGLGRIYNSCILLLGIINDILDLSKIEAGKLDITPTPYNFASLINDSIQLNIMRRGDKPIEFEVQIDENIPAKLIGDEIRIKQILNNLLSNAFKYTETGKVVLSGTFEQGDNTENGTLILSILDTGHGMTKEQVNKLFDEYSRFTQGSERTIEGTGLGMAITRHLLNLMRGSIFVESEPGKGSLFTVRLPQGMVDAEVLGAELADNFRQLRMMNYMSNGKGSQVVREKIPYGSVLIVDDV
ncbi:MAG: response regulator, partial [Leptospirales bacterium]|nr:response regulator [Leptospirales bacterium]